MAEPGFPKLYVLDNHQPLRLDGPRSAAWMIYHGGGKWAPYTDAVDVAHAAVEVDKAAFDQFVAAYDAPRKT